jgi:hypothetical protein
MLTNQQYFADGMHWSVQCGDEIRFSDKDKSIKTKERHSELGDYFDLSFNYEVCEIWDWIEAYPIENKAVVSDIPTLMLAGEYDPDHTTILGQRCFARFGLKLLF